MGLKEVLSKKNMRMLNVFAAVLVIVAWFIRFFYFGKREEIVEKEVTSTNDKGESVTEIKLVKEEQ